ncbi:MAG TPA: hypothetical protein IAB00_01715 [Candidatus Avidehalobacter gallistercoris]|uniref:Phosphoribulokinase/uridine kinase domain-containing protein n=1 Tax=Candidatus Avidehalobacter gallistercoris TaxID=2840694 RepID=A0A9D1HL83_9FIRM|nr:hypothetical protein [Candidatus Avidehalobacter gallistercoris]
MKQENIVENMTESITIDWTWNKEQGSVSTTPGKRLGELMPPPRADRPPIVAALVGNILKDLTYLIFCNAEITWLDGASPLGSRILQNSLAFLLAVAAEREFPDYKLHIFHSLRNGRYCTLFPNNGAPKLNAAAIARLEAAMQDLARQNLPITKSIVTKTDAVSFFRHTGDEPKAETLEQLPDKQVTLYTLCGVTRHMFSKILPETGALYGFSLHPFENGFVLAANYPGADGKPAWPTFAYPKTLNATLDNYNKWIDMQNVNFCCDLNRCVRQNDFNSLVIMAEQRQTRSLQQIADNIADAFPKVRLVLIAGPSSSGKTSFCNRLAIELRSLGLKPITLSMDNYFRNNDDLPPAEDGQPDFEAVTAVDTELFNQQLLQMIAGEPVEMPVFDFVKGERSNRTISVQLGTEHILLVEGIHGINEQLTHDVPAENKLKIYISCMTALNMDSLTPISTSDNREIRRLVRDVKFRGISAEKTLLTWQKVRLGEEKNIFPFQDSADFYFNTSLIYEFSLLAPLITPHLQQIDENSPAYPEARRLLRLVNCFIPADPKPVPAYSLLQEFLGDSVFEV